MQPPQGIVADQAQGDDLVPGLQRKGIVDLDARDFRIERQILRTPVMHFCQPV